MAMHCRTIRICSKFCCCPHFSTAKTKSAEDRKNSTNDDNHASSAAKATSTKKKSSSKKKDGGKGGKGETAPESMQPPPGPLVALGRPKDKAQKRPRSVVVGVAVPLPLLGAQTVIVILCTVVCVGCVCAWEV